VPFMLRDNWDDAAFFFFFFPPALAEGTCRGGLPGGRPGDLFLASDLGFTWKAGFFASTRSGSTEHPIAGRRALVVRSLPSPGRGRGTQGAVPDGSKCGTHMPTGSDGARGWQRPAHLRHSRGITFSVFSSPFPFFRLPALLAFITGGSVRHDSDHHVGRRLLGNRHGAPPRRLLPTDHRTGH